MSDIFDLRAKVSADASPFNKAMDSSATSVSAALSAINSAASMFIGNGVVRAFSRATNAAYEFGQVMADISSISDVGIQQLSKNIKQLDNVYGSMSSVGNSIYNIISSGFDRSEAELLSIVKNVGQASKAIRADLYSTANVFTTVANAYNLSADQFKDIADLLFVTVKEGKAEGNELARTLGLVVNTASEAGLSFAEMSAVISTLSRTQTTSQAMIGFNQMLNAMIKPSKEAAETAEQFGIEFGAAALKSKGFTAIIKDMHDKLQGNVEAINKISGPIRAMRAVVSLTGKQYENFIDILEKAEAKIGTGVAMEAFAKQTDTAKQALENLKVQIDKTFVGVGQDLEPITRYMSEFAEVFLKTFGSGEDLSLGGLGRWSFYISSIIKVIREIREHLSKLQKAISTIGSGTKDTFSTVKTTETSAKNIVDTLPKALTKVQDIRKEIHTTANLLDSIALRLTNVSDISSKIKLQRALVLNPAEVRRTAEANLGIKAGNKKYKDTAPSAKDRYAKAQTAVLNRHGLSTEFLTTPLMLQALNRLGLQSNPFDYKAMTGSEMHKKAMAYASPKEAFKFGYERINEFALNLDKAVMALNNFSTSVSNVKTKLDATMLPADARRVAMAQLYKTEDQLYAQAKRNVDMSHVRVGENGLRDPLSGRFVSRTEAEADELYRLRAELSKARGQVRRDAKTQTIINDESESRYNKAIEAIQRSDLRKTQENASQRKAVAEEILELRRQRRDIDAEITKAATAEDEAYWRNLRIDNANRTAIAKEMLRIRKLRQQEADAIEKEIKAHEEMVANLKSRKKLKSENPEAYAVEVRKRFSRMFNAVPTKDLRFFSRVVRKVGIGFERSFEQILGSGGALSKLYNGFHAVTASLAAWETGWAIGTSLRKTLKVDDWDIIKNLGDLWEGKSWGESRRQQEEQQKLNIAIGKQTTQKMADRLLSLGKLTDAEHSSISAEITLAQATEALAKLRNKMAGKDTPKEDNKPVKTEEEVDKENAERKAEALRKARVGEVVATKSTGEQDELWEVLNDYDLPENIKRLMFSHLKSDNWKEGSVTTGQSIYNTKLDALMAELDEAGWGKLGGATRNVKEVTADIHRLEEEGPAVFDKILAKAYAKARAVRATHATMHADKRVAEAEYAQDKEGYTNKANEAADRFKQSRTAAIDTSKYANTSFNIDVDGEHIRDAEHNSALFKAASKNFEIRQKEYRNQRDYLSELVAEMKDEGMLEDDIKTATASFNSNLDAFHKELILERDNLAKLAQQQAELPKQSADARLDRDRAMGIDVESESYLRGRVKQYDRLSEGQFVYANASALETDMMYRRKREYQDIADTAFNELMQARESIRKNKVSAGMMTESAATRGNIADLQEAMKRIQDSIKQFESLRARMPKHSVDYTYYSNRIEDAQGKLADASIKLRGEFNKLSEESNEVRKGLMNAIQSFTSKDNRLSIENLTKMGGRWTYGAAGRMSNDALWHSVNLASRMGGIVRSRPYMISTSEAPNRQKAAQMRQQAQGAVSASVDAWIMSQKYAEANVGKTVTDIYTFMKQNNTIVVRNK